MRETLPKSVIKSMKKFGAILLWSCSGLSASAADELLSESFSLSLIKEGIPGRDPHGKSSIRYAICDKNYCKPAPYGS